MISEHAIDAQFSFRTLCKVLAVPWMPKHFVKKLNCRFVLFAISYRYDAGQVFQQKLADWCVFSSKWQKLVVCDDSCFEFELLKPHPSHCTSLRNFCDLATDNGKTGWRNRGGQADESTSRLQSISAKSRSSKLFEKLYKPAHACKQNQATCKLPRNPRETEKKVSFRGWRSSFDQETMFWTWQRSGAFGPRRVTNTMLAVLLLLGGRTTSWTARGGIWEREYNKASARLNTN